MVDFSEDYIERYSRHILLDNVGVEGQVKLRESKILVIGAGGLGAPALLYLAAAGVGTIGIVDGDCVDLSNLQRQVCHFTADIGTPKVISARDKMLAINPDLNIEIISEFVTAQTICDIIRPWDFVLDGTDSFGIKFMINDACVLEKKPFSHGGILRFQGQTLTVLPHETACYRCAFFAPPPPDAVPSCSQAGVLGAIAGMLGTIQAAEALKYFLGVGDLLTNRILSFDALKMSFREVPIQIRSQCEVCSDQATILKPIEPEAVVCDLSQKGKG